MVDNCSFVLFHTNLKMRNYMMRQMPQKRELEVKIVLLGYFREVCDYSGHI